MTQQETILSNVLAEKGIGFSRFEVRDDGAKVAVFCYHETEDGFRTSFPHSIESISSELLSDGMPSEAQALMADVRYVALLRYHDELSLEDWMSRVEAVVHEKKPSAQFDDLGDSITVRNDAAQVVIHTHDGYIVISDPSASFGIRVSHVRPAAEAVIGVLA